MHFLRKSTILLFTDLIMLVCIWSIDLHLIYVISLLLTELFLLFYFMIFYIYKNKPKEDRFLMGIVTSALFSFIILYGLLNVFHMFLPPVATISHYKIIGNIWSFDDFWLSINYLSVTVALIVANAMAAIRYQPQEENDESVFKANQLLTKFVLISISFVAAHVAFPLEQKISREEVDLVMKTVSTLIVSGIALTDLYFNTKRRNARI